jgi:hypothetical protein
MRACPSEDIQSADSAGFPSIRRLKINLRVDDCKAASKRVKPCSERIVKIFS